MIFLTRQGNITLGKIRAYTFRTSCYPFSTCASLKIKHSCRNAIDRNIIQGGADLLKIVKKKTDPTVRRDLSLNFYLDPCGFYECALPLDVFCVGQNAEYSGAQCINVRGSLQLCVKEPVIGFFAEEYDFRRLGVFARGRVLFPISQRDLDRIVKPVFRKLRGVVGNKILEFHFCYGL